MLKEISSTADFLREQTGEKPVVGLVLGSGLGNLTDSMEITHSFDYKDIPGFPETTVEGHAGRLVFGRLNGKPVVAMQGRFHYYEGHSMHTLVFPIRVMAKLGVKYLFLSNASGGVNPDFEIGDLMIQTDHINLFPSNPLMGPNEDELGPRFPDMSQSYNANLIQMATDAANKLGIKVQKGIYAGVSGPCLETPAEYHYIRVIGADTVGMSTVPEVIAGHHMGLACFAMSVITDLGVPGKIVKVTHEDVQRAAEAAEPKMAAIIGEMLDHLPD
ncbi:purine-nucleoside phosphorylase [bacterium SCSIO 12741]|nr:purine-nucleoside phosphorylase [bacterium SCSIO 12741]